MKERKMLEGAKKEGEMNIRVRGKVCAHCRIDKPVSEFDSCLHEGKIRIRSHCKDCVKILRKEWIQSHPWYKTINAIAGRCSKNGVYGRIGRKNFLTAQQVKYLWERDKAYLMNEPSIDRINSDGNYELSNCRFIELRLNLSLGGKFSSKSRKRNKDGSFI